jgi:hypothetical protein
MYMSKFGNQANWQNAGRNPGDSFLERVSLIFMAVVSFWLIAPQPAHAYINLATGSLLVQAWAASWFALLFYGKALCRPLSDFMKMRSARKGMDA